MNTHPFKMFRPGITVVLPNRFGCAVCGREDLTVRGFAGHINYCCNKHEMATADYEGRHSMRLYSPVHQFAAKWFSLVDFSIYDFGLMDYANLYWCHIHANQPRDWYRDRYGRRRETLPLLRFKDKKPLLRGGFYHFREHLRGSLTLGIWPNLDNRFTLIDLDGEQVTRWKDLCERLIDLRLHFYIEFSGNKGIHFWIFWDRTLENSDLLLLHDFLCEDIETDHNIWPFKRSILKLPLGLHRSTSLLSCFLDHAGDPIPLENQLSYFLKAKENPIPSAFLNDLKSEQQFHPHKSEGLVSDIVTRPDLSNSSEFTSESPSCYGRLLADGTKLDSGRHRTLFHLAIYLKNSLGFSLDDAERALSDWSLKVESKRKNEERLRDCHSTVMKVYEKDLGFSQSLPSPLTKKEIEVLESVCASLISVCVAVGSKSRKEDLTKRLKSTIKVAGALASLAKARGGIVETNYRQLMKIAKVSWHALQRALKVLVEDSIPVINVDTESDSVLLNMDLRPKRKGGMFLCLHRATYANRQDSKYQMKDEVVEKLGWTHEDSKGKSY